MEEGSYSESDVACQQSRALITLLLAKQIVNVAVTVSDPKSLHAAARLLL